MTQFFVLIKKEGFSESGSLLTAKESAQLLIENRIWPLWEKTNCRKMVSVGDELLIYLAGRECGAQSVIASAKIIKISQWNRKVSATYPLMLDGVPERVLHLSDIRYFQKALHVPSVLDKLSFTPKDKSKWGVKFMGGMRNLNKRDFAVLSGC